MKRTCKLFDLSESDEFCSFVNTLGKLKRTFTITNRMDKDKNLVGFVVWYNE